MANQNTDMPLTSLIKKALNESSKFLIEQGVLNKDGSIDKEQYPLPCGSANTSRDLTILLIKQHDFLVNRVGTLTTLGSHKFEALLGEDAATLTYNKFVKQEE
jgi:hypothetical protein